MSWEQRNHDFAKAQTDAQMAYIEAERENKQLRELVRDMYRDFDGTMDFADYERRMRELEIEVDG